MAAAKLNLFIDQGATWRYGLVLKAGPSADALPMNLTGYTARMQVRSIKPLGSPTSVVSTLIVELTSANGRIELGGVDGSIKLVLSATDTALLDFERSVYDLEIESAGGEVTRVVEGNVSLSRQVTKDE